MKLPQRGTAQLRAIFARYKRGDQRPSWIKHIMKLYGGKTRDDVSRLPYGTGHYAWKYTRRQGQATAAKITKQLASRSWRDKPGLLDTAELTVQRVARAHTERLMRKSDLATNPKIKALNRNRSFSITQRMLRK